ncbi:polysaccharide deacetylase family protein [Brachybacterium vulturis]|uniref:polysaccharide deacetylase family protein n=1 Tax=Brachybacterium vulturis TaxID=2017484 RepID=UPI0037350D10
MAEGAVGAPAVALADPLARGWLSGRGDAALAASLEPAPGAVPDAPAAPEPPGDCTGERCLALTFDDGPSPETTPRLLDILAEHQVRATFFVLGSQARAFPEILARQIAEGHEVANHSWSHPDLTSLSEDALREEVVRTNEAIEEVTGSSPTLLRPPYGATGPTVARVAADLEMVQAMWDVDTRDWEHHDPARTLAAVGDASAGSMILMHDIHATTVDAVEDVIMALRGEGFGFATVSSLLGDVTAGAAYRAAT